MVLLFIFFKASYDDIANSVSRIMANDLKYHSIYSVERIRQQNFTQSILKFCKDLSPMLLRTRITLKRLHGSQNYK